MSGRCCTIRGCLERAACCMSWCPLRRRKRTGNRLRHLVGDCRTERHDHACDGLRTCVWKGSKGLSSRLLRETATCPSLSSLPERNRWNTNSTCLAVSSSWRTRSRRSPRPSGPTRPVEFLADDERSADREAVGPRDRCDTLGKFEDPLVSYRDRIQLPDRTGRHIPQWTGQIPPFVDTVGISV